MTKFTMWKRYSEKNQDKLPALCWLPKLHKRPCKARFIASNSLCTTTELSQLLSSCRTTVKNMWFDNVKSI